VGTLLRVLELDTYLSDIQVLVEALTAKWSQLKTLSCHALNHQTSEQLARFLPGMMSLRNLSVNYVQCNPATLTRALRQNGSLQTVSVDSVQRNTMFGTAEWQRIQSYCYRNRWATGMLEARDNDGLMREAIGPHGDMKRTAS
jgi:hypothetical protein